MKINEIKELLQQDEISKEVLEKLRTDDRSGVKKLLSSYDKRQEKKLFYKKEYEKKSFYENKCYNRGCKYICGIDEVGRGPLAGPVVAAAVILKKDSYFEGLNDSKKLSEKKREELYDKIDAMPFENYPIPNYSMVKGDEKSVSIAAASVIAKVYRDNLMKKYASKYPYYDLENNAGYGTKKHLEGLRKHGITPIHRRDFEPIKSMIKRGGNNGQ